MGTLHGSWLWYELMSPDPDGSKAFYEPVVGWTMSTGHNGDQDYGFIANPDGGMTGGVLKISDDMKAGGCVPAWIGYIGVDDVDAFLPRLEAAGGKVLMPARTVDMAGRIAMVTDCCGAPFYVMTPTPPPGGGESTAFSPALQGRCGWNELRASDQASALAFYRNLFGWVLPEPMDLGPMGMYQFIEHDCVTLGAIMAKPPGLPADHPNHWTHYFRVASIETAITAIAGAGGQIMFGPQEVPGGDWIVQALDPQAAGFSLVGGK